MAKAQSTTSTIETHRLSMKETIMLAQEQSIQSMVSKNIYAAEYWRYRSYRAGRLPSLNLTTGIANIDRSIQPLQNSETGEINYRSVFTLGNDVSLYMRQRISATGGEIRLQSYLQRFDQFAPDNLTWYSQPIALQYIQPLFSISATIPPPSE